jgi:enterochelin esterase-like enzyme
VLAITVALSVTGLIGAYSYWESYYQHRGFAAVAYLPHAHKGRKLTVHFYSAALHREADYLVYLPPGYSPTHRYPVYYLLHGSPGRPQVYYAIGNLDIRLANLISQGRARPMILVFPDGRIDGSTYSDSEWANTPSGNFEGYVVEAVNDVDHRFSTLPSRADRVIAGFSAGAYGATNIALHHLNLFEDLQSWSGYYIETRSGVFAHVSRATLADNSPLDYVKRIGPQLAANPLRAFMFTGRDDDSSLQLPPMAQALAARGARVSYALYHGGHDWQLWHAHLNQLLILASRDFTAPLPAGHAPARTLTPGVAPIPHGKGRRHRHRRHARHAHRRHPHRYVLVSDTVPHRSPVARRAPGSTREPGQLGIDELLGGLLLALGSAALINLGFLLQHQGLADSAHRAIRPAHSGTLSVLRGAFRNRVWLAGQALGWIGFLSQIVAVAIAPLSLVQAFAAGGLALSVPLAAGFFAQRITRSQVLAVMLMAASLAVLPIGFSTATDRLSSDALTVSVTVAVLAAAGITSFRAAWPRAIAAGIFYGVADAAIKAVSLGWHAHGLVAVWSGWTVLAALTTFCGFLAFQSALRDSNAVSSISLMTALAALVALGCGLIAFGESLGAGVLAVAVHVLAIAVVLGCVPVLAAAQARLAEPTELADGVKAARAPVATA